jgi:hypothetical protein
VVDARERCRALEQTAFVVAANQGASLQHYPPYLWSGGSMVVDYDGRILAEAPPGPGERIVVAPMDISALRHEGATCRGHHMLAHLRSEGYPVYGEHRYPPETTDPRRAGVLRAQQRADRRRQAEAGRVAPQRVTEPCVCTTGAWRAYNAPNMASGA